MQCQSSAFGGGGERVRFLHSGSPVQRFQKEEAFQVVTARTPIIDIGSTSVRMVVYDGPRRIPYTLFNEKVLEGLGASQATTAAIQETDIPQALVARARFLPLCCP